MAQIEVPMTDEQMAALADLAKRRGVSLPELVREGVASLLRSAAAPPDGERQRRALAVVGRFRSGRGDLSGRHDHYLAEESEP